MRSFTILLLLALSTIPACMADLDLLTQGDHADLGTRDQTTTDSYPKD